MQAIVSSMVSLRKRLVKRNCRDWSSMPPDILESISDRLPLVDFFNFRGVCSPWRRAPSAGRANITKFSKDKPWLIFYDVHNRDDRCYFYSDSYCCTFRLPDLKGATIVESKLGWFLAHRDGGFFYYNPFSFEKIDIGKHYVVEDQAYTFSTNPTSSSCTAYIVTRKGGNELEIASRRIDEEEWAVKSVNASRKIGRMLGLYSCRCIEGLVWIFDLLKQIRRGKDYSEDVCSGVTIYGLVGDTISPILDMNLLRADDWVHKFGAGGISVSSISMCCCLSASDPIGRFAEAVEVVVDGDEASKSHELKIVKAAWIQPTLA